jgi:hypothetical protein
LSDAAATASQLTLEPVTPPIPPWHATFNCYPDVLLRGYRLTDKFISGGKSLKVGIGRYFSLDGRTYKVTPLAVVATPTVDLDEEATYAISRPSAELIICSSFDVPTALSCFNLADVKMTGTFGRSGVAKSMDELNSMLQWPLLLLDLLGSDLLLLVLPLHRLTAQVEEDPVSGLVADALKETLEKQVTSVMERKMKQATFKTLVRAAVTDGLSNPKFLVSMQDKLGVENESEVEGTDVLGTLIELHAAGHKSMKIPAANAKQLKRRTFFFLS